jgi:hypothetical protein
MKQIIAYYWHRYGFPWLIAVLVGSIWIGTAHAADKPYESYCQGSGQWAAQMVQLRDLGNDRSTAYAIVLEITHYNGSSINRDWYHHLTSIIDAVYNDREWKITPERAQDLTYSACIGAKGKM